MIDKLTPEQEAKLQEYADKGIAIGLSLHEEEDFNAQEIFDLCDMHRALCGVPKATIYEVYDSPFAAIKAVPGLTTHNALYGQHDINWLQFYKFFRDECGLVAETEKIVYLYELAKRIGWFWMSSNAVIITKKPIALYMRPKGDVQVLHREDGRALEYADGTGLYMLNGISIQAESWLVTTPLAELDVARILQIENSEVRTEGLKLLGMERAIDSLEHRKVVHEHTYPQGGHYILLDISLDGDNWRKYLRMVCPSSGKLSIEAVHPDCSTVANALTWRETGKIQEIYIEPVSRT